MSGPNYYLIIIMNNYIICPLCIMDLFPSSHIFGLFKLYFIFSTSILFTYLIFKYISVFNLIFHRKITFHNLPKVNILDL